MVPKRPCCSQREDSSEEGLSECGFPFSKALPRCVAEYVLCSDVCVPQNRKHSGDSAVQCRQLLNTLF